MQIHCYEDTRIMKAFPQILKVLYNKDCISDQAIIYWYQKGSKPQGRQHFLKITEPLVQVFHYNRVNPRNTDYFLLQFLQQQESSEEED